VIVVVVVVVVVVDASTRGKMRALFC